MRLLFPVAIALAATASAAPLSQKHSLPKSSDCPKAANQFAGKGGLWRGDPAKPKKLNELPPADAYAAVYRTDERGCMVLVKYREVRR